MEKGWCYGLNCAPHLNSQVEGLTLSNGILHLIAFHFIVLCMHRFLLFKTNWRFVARLHQASLLAPFFQWHLATLRLCVTFSQFLQYFKLLNHYYICYSDMWCALLKILLIYLFLTVLGLRCCVGFSLVAASQGYSSLQCMGFSQQWLLLLQSIGSSTWASVAVVCGSVAAVPGLWSTGSVVGCLGLIALWHVGSSQISIESMLPALESGFFTTESSGKPNKWSSMQLL